MGNQIPKSFQQPRNLFNPTQISVAPNAKHPSSFASFVVVVYSEFIEWKRHFTDTTRLVLAIPNLTDYFKRNSIFSWVRSPKSCFSKFGISSPLTPILRVIMQLTQPLGVNDSFTQITFRHRRSISQEDRNVKF